VVEGSPLELPPLDVVPGSLVTPELLSATLVLPVPSTWVVAEGVVVVVVELAEPEPESEPSCPASALPSPPALGPQAMAISTRPENNPREHEIMCKSPAYYDTARATVLTSVVALAICKR